MQPFTLLIKPTGSDCNIDCDYCFYTNRSPEIGQGKQRMTDQVLERFTQDYLELGFSHNTFSWQGGEPTLMGLDFFKKAVAFQDQYRRPNQQIVNALQTNGILINDEWASFCKEHQWLLGISGDGPQHIHDHYRKDLGGHGTWERVMRGIETCKKHDVEFNVLVLVNRISADYPDEIIDFFLHRDIHWLQFIPCVEQVPETGEIADFSVTPEQYGTFLCRVLDRWLELGPTKLSIRDFESMVQHCIMGQHSVCTYQRHCADYIVIEHTGDTYPCDFFVRPEEHLGNILETPVGNIAKSQAKRSFIRRKTKLPAKCTVCPHLNLCRGGCMKDRLLPLGQEEGTHENYLCPSYKTFFTYALPKIQLLAAQLRANHG